MNTTTIIRCGSISFLAVILLCSGCNKSRTPEPVQFQSVHFVFVAETKSSAQSESMTSEIWQQADKMRIERADGTVFITAAPHEYKFKKGEQVGLRITRTKKNNPSIPPLQETLQEVREIKSAGKLVKIETLDGIECERYEAERSASGRLGGPLKSTVWLSRSTGFPVKIVQESGGGISTKQYQNVEINNPLSNELFEPPTEVRLDDVNI